MKTKKWKQMTEAEYQKIKTLADVGLTNAQIHGVTGRSTGTIARVKASKDLESYRAEIRSQRNKWVAKNAVNAVALPPEEDIAVPSDMWANQAEAAWSKILQNISDSLSDIKDKLNKL